MENVKSVSDNTYRIAVGLDGSEKSWRALAEAFSFAKYKKAELHAISVQETVDASYSAGEVLACEQTARQKLELIHIRARMEAEEAGLEIITAICDGNTVKALTKYVKNHKINLLILGDTGHLSILGALLGTTVERVVRDAPCSVLVVRN
jgi:nucleotide-binding universal stress UspA family protein